LTSAADDSTHDSFGNSQDHLAPADIIAISDRELAP
jgi:hypothetical protein